LEQNSKASKAFKILRVIAGCAVAIAIAPVVAKISMDGISSIDRAILKGTEDDPARISPTQTSTSNPAPTSDELDCGSDAAKRLAMKVVKENPPSTLLVGSVRFDALSRERTLCDDAFDTTKSSIKSCYDAADGATADWPNLAHLCLGDAEHERECQAKVAACDQSDQTASSAKQACYDNIDTKSEAARHQATYSIKNIRLEGRDPTTGAIMCNVTLHADLANNFGSGEEEISYKLEKMEDGGIHIDMTGLR
jgi:hypothetical protein